ncbi:DNA topoisomerase IB [Brevibacterium album]|uniref:DNA topoisomerase IB n=1 Tax=Brevibacterium album TaxID=417948 RepID=UPI00048E63B0|nr:DNA topoisomerase IB [Brevibacterium album]
MASASGARGRLRRSDPASQGITRRRRGTGWSFRTPDGETVRDAAERQRLLDLAVPPAWRRVWISPDPRGHIQAVGIDEAGRRQYIYHPAWHQRQAKKKFDRVLAVGPALPAARRKVTVLLRSGGTGLACAQAAAFRLLDRFGIRVGGEEYAEAHGTYGLTTMLGEHVQVSGEHVRLSFLGKSHQPVELETRDRDLAEALSDLRGRRDEPALRWHGEDGWTGLSGPQVNEFLQEVTGIEMTAKDFRTWHATVHAARALARLHDPAASPTRRRRAVNTALDEVAGFLCNTRAIARSSYVDPRVIDRFMDGETLEAKTYHSAERRLPDFLG